MPSKIDVKGFWQDGFTLIRRAYTPGEIEAFRRDALEQRGKHGGDLLSNPFMNRIMLDGKVRRRNGRGRICRVRRSIGFTSAADDEHAKGVLRVQRGMNVAPCLTVHPGGHRRKHRCGDTFTADVLKCAVTHSGSVAPCCAGVGASVTDAVRGPVA